MTELPPTHPIRWKLILWLSEEKSEYPFGEELLKVMELPQRFLPQAEIELYIQQNDEYNDNDAVFRNSILMLKAKYCSAFERELNGWLGVVQSLAALKYLSSKKSLALQYLSSKKSRSTGHSRPSLLGNCTSQPSELQTLIHEMNSTFFKWGKILLSFLFNFLGQRFKGFETCSNFLWTEENALIGRDNHATPSPSFQKLYWPTKRIKSKFISCFKTWPAAWSCSTDSNPPTAQLFQPPILSNH